VTRNAEFKTLGLSPDANWEDVKRAFRQLARTYHPDVAGPDGARKFAEITAAYMTLKELKSLGTGKISRPGYARPEEAPVAKEARREESIFKKFWRKLFSRDKTRTGDFAEEDDLPPVRVRFIGSVISRAESEMYSVLSKRDEFVSRNRTDAIIRRLGSKHPAVVLLALRQISIYNVKDEIAAATIEHFKRNIPASEVLERVLDVFSNSPKREELSKAMLLHLNKFSEADSMVLLSRFKRWKLPAGSFQQFLYHKSPAVVAGAVSCWPAEVRIGEKAELVNLLKKDEEVILVPLLRLLRHEKLPPWAGMRLEKLVKEHPSPAVRVWASAIVRDQNLS
jgi:curved DNA-binding protein CbpA